MPEPKIAKKGPYVIDMEPDTYIWCGCGLSKNQPFCDNAHKGTEYEGTDKAAFLVEIEEEGKKPWCGCKKTKTPPWCDGTHTSL
jgi:CDGSH-type Zn-finger protein|tara:strand:+ start:862 stop:1113 length:252 start_codon:yes stop_codon:yes gene_type:complete